MFFSSTTVQPSYSVTLLQLLILTIVGGATISEVVETGYRSKPSVAVAKSERARRDGTMTLARTSGHVLANLDNVAVFWSRRKQFELRKTLQLYVYLQIHQPMADRKSE
ncbi:hypothetical protein NP493_106g07045 [Ridgeia piscesae]|uniref:Uncharacterized protein n=1 Tax=Ridgeia piscesae TaxID=27915 RepID=A0AAD9P796_RIDPI|nr:hypothetical protein NP493_106g07045 [Ridgeia piscesae]